MKSLKVACLQKNGPLPMHSKYLSSDLINIASPDVLQFVTAWQIVTSRPITYQLCLCDVLDLLRDFSPTFHHEWSTARPYENILILHEAPTVVGFDGEHLLYNCWYEAVRMIKKLLVVDSMKRMEVAS